MEGYPDTIIPANDWVRALYDYESEDRTSLSFQSGDVVQVLTRLDSGWWDGVINGQRGWFPSNYCEVVSPKESRQLDHAFANGTLGTSSQTEADDVNGEEDRVSARPSQGRPYSSGWQLEGRDKDEEVFWIPQCSEDGTLFYFNTYTGQSRMTLPLETLSAGPGAEDGEDGTGNHNIGTRDTRGVHDIDSEDGGPDDQSGSETEGLSQSRSSPRQKRNSYMSDGASPATSLESLSVASTSKSSGRRTSKSSSSTGKSRRPASSIKGAGMSLNLSAVPARFLDYGTAVPLTWDSLLSDIKASIERYKHAIEHDERSNYVRRAEDISDHVRLVLAAGSSTTDNHSGNPSIISANKTLYPRFRDMMSSFAKLVLDSHISAADYSPSDYSSKCIQDADGVMEGVYGYIEVARQQRGEEVPRLFPGFLGDHHAGGNWKKNGLLSQMPSNLASSQFNDEDGSGNEPSKYLDAHVIAQMDGLRREIVFGLRRLADRLMLKDKLISYPKHRRLTREVCAACQEVFELYRPWMANLESITLAPLGSRFQTPQIAEFAEAKQRVYNSVADLVMSCQSVGAPLADEWAQDRGLPLEDRLERVKAVSADLEATTSRVNTSLQILQDIMPAQPPRGHKQNSSVGSRSLLGDISSAISSSENDPNAGMFANAHSKKLQKMFGQLPPVSSPSRDSMTSMEKEDVPRFLKLEHENEVVLNNKTDPPSVQGGTLTGLVEQLTRHDIYNPGFMNTFLYTYQSFMTGQELFERLVQRWSVQPPPGLSEEEYSLWEDKLQRPVRFRVYNILRNWVEFYWMEENDVNEQQLLSQIYSFGRDTIGNSNLSSNRALLAVLDARLKGEEPHSRKTVASYMEGPPPKLPKNMKKFKFTDVDPTEFARQLTIIQQRLYCQIKPSECLARTWGSKINSIKEVDDQKGIRDNIRHANQVTNYMAETILSQSDQKKRVLAIKNVIYIADACFQMSNFATLTAVLSSLGMSAVVRMNRMHNMLDKKAKERLEFLRVVMATEKNYGAYREALRNAQPPSLPFLGITLQDMRFVEDGMSNQLPGTGLINFHKRTAMADQVRLLMSYQNITYPFKSSAELQSYINDRVAQAGNVDLYEMSLKAEPREREDEKIARLLSESGFL